MEQEYIESTGIFNVGEYAMQSSVPIVAVIPAAGSGRRMNANINKIWLPLGGRNVLSYTLQVFLASEFIQHIILVVNPAEMEDFERFLDREAGDLVPAFQAKSSKITLVAGGDYRQQSVANALQFLKSWPGWSGEEKRLVVIHDAARALLTHELLEKSIQAGLQFGAAGIGVPVKDTIKQVNPDGLIIATPDRSTLWAIQTPQVFDYHLITICYDQAAGILPQFSDDCGIVEYCGHPVKLLEGSYENLKITTPEDLLIAEAILQARAKNNGY
jgi:2-C-methyl-D-erythritol 4-phosphate cytidylyltransferase